MTDRDRLGKGRGKRHFMKKRLVALGLIVVMVLGGTQIAGATRRSEAQRNLNAVNAQISEIESRQASLQAEIDAVDADLVQVLIDINTTKADIEAKKVELAQAEADLAEAKATEEEQYESMKERIRYMYENGDSSFLTALMGADSFADVLNKVESFSKVYDYDRNLLVEYQNTKLEVENLVNQVAEEEGQLEEIQQTLQEQQKELETVKAEKSSQMDDFETKLAQAQSLAAEYEATIREQNQVLTSSVNGAATSVSTGTSGSSSVSSRPGSSASVGSSSGQAVANYACQFIGNPYKWGGTSLTNGADCSGFVMSVYAHFGVSLPHSSSAMRSVGRGVSVSDMQPGDIVCYSGHVGIYVGNNTIVNASNSKPYPAGGIKYTSATYKSILAVRRIF